MTRPNLFVSLCLAAISATGALAQQGGDVIVMRRVIAPASPGTALPPPADPTPTPVRDGKWSTSWQASGACSAAGQPETGVNVCVVDGSAAGDDRCVEADRPAKTRNVSCTYEWREGTYVNQGPVNTCGMNTEVRTNTCLGNGIPALDAASCGPAPHTQRRVVDQTTCNIEWNTGLYLPVNACSSSIVKVRTVQCINRVSAGSVTASAMDDEACVALYGAKPATDAPEAVYDATGCVGEWSATWTNVGSCTAGKQQQTSSSPKCVDSQTRGLVEEGQCLGKDMPPANRQIDCVVFAGLLNGGFENSSGWAFDTGTTYGTVTGPSQVIAGSRSLFIDLSSKVNVFAHQIITTTPGKSYTMTFKAGLRNGSFGDTLLVGFNSTTKVLNSGAPGVLATSMGGFYQGGTRTVSFTATSASTYVSIGVKATSTSYPIRMVVDDVVVIEN